MIHSSCFLQALLVKEVTVLLISHWKATMSAILPYKGLSEKAAGTQCQVAWEYTDLFNNQYIALG